jgi:hypothetical protein
MDDRYLAGEPVDDGPHELELVYRDLQTAQNRIADLTKALSDLLVDAGEGDARGRALDLLPRKTIEAAEAALAKALP